MNIIQPEPSEVWINDIPLCANNCGLKVCEPILPFIYYGLASRKLCEICHAKEEADKLEESRRQTLRRNKQ